MQIRSLAFRTDLALLALGGSEVADHGSHLAIRTPHNANFWWGNFLLLADPPAAEEVPDWLARFGALHAGARHVAIGVDATRGSADDLGPLIAAGLEADVSAVMTADSVQPPPHPNRDAVIRPLAGDDDWAQQVELSMAGEPDWYERAYATRREVTNRQLTEAGHGVWFGAFLGGRLASSLGLMRAGDGLARFQSVKTHPDARGAGLAGTLVHAASTYGFTQLGARTLVMVADPEYHAIRVYSSVGFVESEVQLAAIRRPVG